jgi:hypothetical protein
MPGLAIALRVLEKRSKNRNFKKSRNGHSYHVVIGTCHMTHIFSMFFWRSINLLPTLKKKF